MFGFATINSFRNSRGACVAVTALAILLGGAVAYAQTSQSESSKTQPEPPASKTPDAGEAAQQGPDKGTPQAQPKIHVDEPTLQFGQVWAGDPIKHTFEIRNLGDAVLKITKVKPSCGCTLAGKYDREIPPGGVGTIPISVKTDRLRAKVNKSITVSSNDPDQPTVKLYIKGAVKQRFVMSPARGPNFGRIQPGQKLEQTITLTNNTDAPIKLTLPTPKAGVFTGELIEKTPGKVYELIVRAEGPYRERMNNGTFSLKPESGGGTVTVKASALLPPRIEVTPREVAISKTTKPFSKTVKVSFNAVELYTLLAAEVDDPKVSVSVAQTDERKHTITLDFPAGYLPPSQGRTLTISTDDPKRPKHVLKLKSRVRPAELLAGKPVPVATFETPDGTSIASTTTNGDVTLLKFYASWCGYCKRALPKIDQMAKDYADKPIRFIAISQDSIVEFGAKAGGRRSRTKEQIIQQWKDLGLTLTQAFDPSGAGRSKFKVQSFPTMFLVGPTGRIERVYLGGGAVNNGSLKKDIDTLLGGKSLALQGGATKKTTQR